MSANQLFILKKKIDGAELPYLIRLNRNKSQLEIFKKCDNEKLYENLSIRQTYNADSYAIFEKISAFDCIFGGETTPTPIGLFHIEAKSKEEYVSSYYTGYKQVKFFGYLVIFEDYFIHSDLYPTSETGPTDGKAISSNDRTTSGCIRVSQENLCWLIENATVGTLVLL